MSEEEMLSIPNECIIQLNDGTEHIINWLQTPKLPSGERISGQIYAYWFHITLALQGRASSSVRNLFVQNGKIVIQAENSFGTIFPAEKATRWYNDYVVPLVEAQTYSDVLSTNLSRVTIHFPDKRSAVVGDLGSTQACFALSFAALMLHKLRQPLGLLPLMLVALYEANLLKINSESHLVGNSGRLVGDSAGQDVTFKPLSGLVKFNVKRSDSKVLPSSTTGVLVGIDPFAQNRALGEPDHWVALWDDDDGTTIYDPYPFTGVRDTASLSAAMTSDAVVVTMEVSNA